MADPAASDESTPVRHGLRRCSGGQGCPCVSPSEIPLPSSRRTIPTSTGNPRSGSANHDEHHSGNSSDSSDGIQISDSQATSDVSIPDVVHEFDWSGMSVVKLPKCEHGRHAVLKKCWGGKNTGRRFLGCPVQVEVNQCQFVEWLDEPWPDRVQDSMKAVWKELKGWKRAEEKATDALLRAIENNDQANAAKVAMQEEVNRTKRVAQRVCAAYHRKAAVAVIDKSKLMYLIYCLLGVIVFLLVAILFSGKGSLDDCV